MKKLLLMCMLVLSMVANAQTQPNYCGSSSFWDNWSVGVNGGVQTNLHDWNAPQGAIVGINLDKEITPIVGLSLETNVGFNNNANWVCENLLSDSRHMSLSHPNGTAIENLSAFVDGRFNLTNAFWGYKGYRRPVEVSAVAGVGYMHGYDNIPNSGYDLLITKAGLNFDVNPSDAWTFRIAPAVLWNTSITSAYDCRFATGQITAGVVYHFVTSNGTHHMNKPVLYDADLVDRLNARINDLENRRPQVVEKVITKEVVYPENSWTVSFPFGSAELNDEAKTVLNTINGPVSVVGYASYDGKDQTELNQKLSEARAEVVTTYLKNKGVDVTSTTGAGANDYSGRVVTINK